MVTIKVTMPTRMYSSGVFIIRTPYNFSQAITKPTSRTKETIVTTTMMVSSKKSGMKFLLIYRGSR